MVVVQKIAPYRLNNNQRIINYPSILLTIFKKNFDLLKSFNSDVLFLLETKMVPLCREACEQRAKVFYKRMEFLK